MIWAGMARHDASGSEDSISMTMHREPMGRAEAEAIRCAERREAVSDDQERTFGRHLVKRIGEGSLVQGIEM